VTTTLITGANKGIGRETARRLIEAGHSVFIGARDVTRGQQAADDLGAQFVQMDVTDDASVAAALDGVRDRADALDVLINNAGIPDNTLGTDYISTRTAQQVFDTNVLGLIRVTQAALPLLRKSGSGVIVNVSSGLGSFSANTDPARPESTTSLIVYAASKAAVEMLTLKYSQILPELRVNAACPGLTATDFAAGFPGAQPVEAAVEVIVKMATISSDGPTGTVQESDGPLGW
jgi:NAD(P)-dependent dehydrogenase (short-subunit alcohol dehydrogenase family)